MFVSTSTRIKSEADELERLILARIGVTVRRERDGGELSHQEAFIGSVFKEKVVRWRVRAPRYGRLDGGLNVLVIALGLASSTIIASTPEQPATSFWHVTAIMIGALVGVLAAVRQAVKPGERHDRYLLASREMRFEAWNLVNQTGRYRDLPPEDVYRTFAEIITDLYMGVNIGADLKLPPPQVPAGEAPP